MGISLKDLGNFAVGAIERDRELTKEDFEIRNANLAANRDMLIKQKEKKYEKELDNYYEEKEKFDRLNSAAADFKDKKINARTYASIYLSNTMPEFKNFTADVQEDLVNNFDGKTTGYTLTGSVDEINKNAAAEQTAINDATVAAIKEAKGDSFLINKILRKKGVDDKKLLDDIQSKISAVETVDLTEQNIDKSLVGLDVKVGGGSEMSNLMSKFLKNKNSDKYQSEWSKQRDKINFDLTKKDNNTFKFLQSTAQLGGNDELSYKYDSTDGKITGMNQPAIANLNAMEYMFNSIKNNNDTMLNHYYTVTQLHGDIGKTWNSDTIYNQMKNVLDGRGGNINEGNNNPFKANIRLTTFVPLSLVNQNNEMIFSNGTIKTFNKEQMNNLSNTMNLYIANKANAMRENNKDKDVQSLAETVYERLYNGDSGTLNELIKFASDNNLKGFEVAAKPEETPKGDNTSTSTTIQDNKPSDTTTTTTSNIVADVGIKSNDGKSIMKWETIESTGQVDQLNTEEKAAYDLWKSKQPTDIEISGNESA